jgi:hypothetical protein
MKSWKTPTPEEVSKAIALLSRAGNYHHFFEKLENPFWVRPLWEKGFFKTPPPPVYEDSGHTAFPRWAESRYLARMARNDPETVAEVLRGILGTENVEVKEDITRALLAMPAKLAASFVGSVAKWVDSPILGKFLASNLGDLVAYLSAKGETDSALMLAKKLLRVVPGNSKVTSEDESLSNLFCRPIGLFDTWYYEQVLQKCIPLLVDHAGLRAITMLCDLLEAAVIIEMRGKTKEEREDFSYIWRPAIEDHDQNMGNTVLDAITSCLRDMAERLCKRDPEVISELVELLESRGWPIFQRISLHLISRFPQVEPSLVEKYIVNNELFDNHQVLHEYYHLCRTGFGRLSAEGKEQVLNWIQEGLDREAVEGWIKADKQEVKQDQIDAIINGWKVEKLAPIKEYLTEEWIEIYERLVSDTEEPRHADFSYWSETGTGPNSPLTTAQLSSMPIGEIITFLKTWVPRLQSPIGPSPEGLGRELSQAVSARPEDFTGLAEEFPRFEPTYLRALLSGLEGALRQGRQFEWKNVLALCDWVAQQPIGIPGRKRKYSEKDPDWSWTRGQIADLLSQGFMSEQGEISFEYRTIVWEILEPLNSDPYPRPEGSASSACREPAMDSWNTTPGKALHAIIKYAAWVRDNMDENSTSNGSVYKGFSSIPEVKSLLENRLDLKIDSHPATRSVYGQRLPSLVWLDSEWVTDNLHKIFPQDDAQDSLWRAAWDGYITLCQVRKPVFEVLRHHYRRAVNSLSQGDSDDHFFADPDSRLVEHLVVVYWNGTEQLESEGSLIQDFFEAAPSKLREHAFYLIGTFLKKQPSELPQEVAERLIRLWEWRRNQILNEEDPTTYKREIAQFGSWFVAGKLDVNWVLEQLLFAIEFSGEIASDYRAVEHLATLAMEFPAPVVKCLDAMAGKTTKLWRIYSWREQAFATLRAVLESGDPAAMQKATKVANRFGEMGFRDFRVLVSPQP